jgi:hypothetical protein
LPNQTIDRVAVGLALNQGVDVQALVKVLVVALGARQIQLPLTKRKQDHARLPIRLGSNANCATGKQTVSGPNRAQTFTSRSGLNGKSQAIVVAAHSFNRTRQTDAKLLSIKLT